MKVAVFAKGPIRPNPEICSENLNNFINQIKSFSEVDEFVFTWNTKNAKKFLDIRPTQNSIILKEPTDDFCLKSLVAEPRMNCSSPRINAYKHFFMMKFASNFIINTGIDYDYIFYMRPDTSYNLRKPLVWFEKDSYVCGGGPSPHPDLKGWLILTDIIGCAPPDVFKKVWDYGTLENLNLSVSNSYFPEDWLQRRILENNIPHKFISVFSEDWGNPRINDDYDFECLMNRDRNTDRKIY